MAVPMSGQLYGDAEKTPVPLARYRCRAGLIEERPHAPHSTLTHPCKLAVDHDGPHRCVCGKNWPTPRVSS